MTKIIPFDINKSGTVKYRNGLVPLEWFYMRQAIIDKPLITVRPNKTWLDHYPNGSKNFTNEHSEWDLMMEVEVKQQIAFINLYPYRKILDGGFLGGDYATLQAADNNKSGSCSDRYVLKVTFTEGEKPTAEFVE